MHGVARWLVTGCAECTLVVEASEFRVKSLGWKLTWNYWMSWVSSETDQDGRLDNEVTGRRGNGGIRNAASSGHRKWDMQLRDQSWLTHSWKHGRPKCRRQRRCIISSVKWQCDMCNMSVIGQHYFNVRCAVTGSNDVHVTGSESPRW